MVRGGRVGGRRVWMVRDGRVWMVTGEMGVNGERWEGVDGDR